MAEQTESTKPWFLRGNWSPMIEERTETSLTVTGSIPAELSGVYLRTGPNPKSGQGDHWFLGDGMVHGIRLSGGKAEWYRNRFIQTPDITDPLADPSGALGDLQAEQGQYSYRRPQQKNTVLRRSPLALAHRWRAQYRWLREL